MKDQLDHHSIKVTVDVYGHLVPGANKAAVDRLDQTAVLLADWRDRLGDWRDQACSRVTWRPPNARAGLRIPP